MSRSDGWSVAFTLLGAGIAYFIGGKYSAWGSIGVAAIIMLYLLFTKTTESPSVSVKQEANPHLTANPTATANPQQHLTVNFPPHPPAEQRPIPPPKLSPKPNLQLSGYRMAKVEDALGDHGSMDGFYFPDDQSEPNAIVACIKNKATSEPVAYISDVRATLTFRDHKEQEIGHVNCACWIDNQLKNATFDLEESHCVLLAVLRDNKCFVPYIKEQHVHFGMGISVEALKVEPIPSSVELNLVSNRSRVMLPKIFDLVEENGEDVVKLRE